MYLRCLPDRSTKSPTSRVCSMVSGGSTRTASVAPAMSVEVIGDDTIGSPPGRRAPLARTTPSDTNVEYDSSLDASGSLGTGWTDVAAQAAVSAAPRYSNGLDIEDLLGLLRFARAAWSLAS